MSKTTSHALQAQLNLLAEQYRLRLSADLPALQHEADALLHASSRDQVLRSLQALHQQLHKLAGSAGTFGFVSIGDQARALELSIDALLAEEPLRTPQRLQTVARETAALAMQEAVRQQDLRLENSARQDQPERPRSIYILEDDLASAQNIQLTLNNFGYAAEHFQHTLALDAAIARRLPDALIVDVNLGTEEPDGISYAQALQKRLGAPIPLLVASSRYDFATQLRAVRAGALGFFDKPLDIPCLENRLERCFSSQQGAPYRVLIIDDDTDLSNRYSLVLRSANMLIEQLDEPTEIQASLRRFKPEVILLDVNMPQCSGPELAQIIRLNDEWLRVPIIYLSAETDMSKQMDALLKAGDDFITKPISDSALITTVFAHAQRARILSNALARDSLTGLLKHADIKEQLSLEAERAQRTNKVACVAMLDIDHFKLVNDNYGHATGDNVIRALANLLRQRLRRIDGLGRYGGEEFLAVLPDCPPDQALRIIDELRERFAQLSFNHAGQSFHVTVSAGLAATETGLTPEMLLARADQALFAAKKAGRNCVKLAEQGAVESR